MREGPLGETERSATFDTVKVLNVADHVADAGEMSSSWRFLTVCGKAPTEPENGPIAAPT
jgi:hypothetical protein